MEIMIISDTHGDIREAIKQYRKLKNVEMIVHLGDYQTDAVKIQQDTRAKVISIKGNSDGTIEDTSSVMNVNDHKILLTHGHTERVKTGLTALYYKARSLSCNIALFGHTHIPLCIQDKDILLLNPGSLTLPKGGFKPSYAILVLENQSVNAKIVYLNS